MSPDEAPRTCREVQAQLPGLVDGSLGRVRAAAVRLHLRRCDACRSALDLQQEMRAVLRPSDEAPPEDLLEALLAQASKPGVRGRVAVPARGAVSGARPLLSLVLLGAAAAAGTGVGWAVWQGGRRVRSLVRG